jgi:hypothetical protein
MDSAAINILWHVRTGDICLHCRGGEQYYPPLINKLKHILDGIAPYNFTFLMQKTMDYVPHLLRAGHSVQINTTLMDSICSMLTSDILITSGSSFPATVSLFALPWEPVVLEERRKESDGNVTSGYFLSDSQSVRLRNGRPLISKLELRNIIRTSPAVRVKARSPRQPSAKNGVRWLKPPSE